MWQEFFKFDLRYQLRQPLLWVMSFPLLLIAFLSAGSEAIRVGGSIGNTHLNAPVVIANQMGVLSMISMFLVTVFIAGAILRDNEVGISDLLFATPMRKFDYLFGRFLAGFLVCISIFALVCFAMILGSATSSVDPARLSEFSLAPYAWGFFVLILPNLLFIASLLMLLAATTRSMILVYVGVLSFIVLWSVPGFLQGSANVESFAVLLDPFGIRALSQATRYYSTLELNTQIPNLSGMLLLNRIIWSVIALGLFVATIILFKPQRQGTGRRWFGRHRVSTVAVQNLSKKIIKKFTAVTPTFDGSTSVYQCWSELRFHTYSVLKSAPFLVMILLAMANFFANYFVGNSMMDSSPYPLTRVIIDELNGGINFMLAIILVFYSGDLVFKERQVNVAGLRDAMPVSNWVPLVAKCGALIAVIFSFLLVGVLFGIGLQLIIGGASIEIGLYLQATLINAIYFVLIALAFVAIQMLVNQKFVGYFLSFGLLAVDMVLKSVNLNHRLVNFASLPTLNYSDVNGYGHFLTGWSWFALYWTLFCIVLLLIALAFTVRGVGQSFRSRLSSGVRQLTGRNGYQPALALAMSLSALVLCGGWIFYNTNVLNHYQSNDQILDAQAQYEKLYRHYLDLPHPSITSVKAEVDIFPAQRSVDIHGHYILKNKGTSAIDTLQLQTDLDATTEFENLPPHQVMLNDMKLGFKVIKLNQALAAGADMALDFKVKVRHPGFTNSGTPNTINLNGTSFAVENFFPGLGYKQSMEIEDKNERRDRGLGEPHGMPKLEDGKARNNNFWKLYGVEADLIDFETTVSTSADQIAIAPGYLQKSWEKDGRRYFHYKMDQPITAFFSYQSGAWKIKKADWRGVPIEIYYDQKHPYNVDSMILGAQRGLDYFADNFGPYPHKQLRVLEIPLYQTFARSFPNTIPFSESLGFISDLRNPELVDHVFYVTAHEVAHQWWGDQIIAANVQGSGMVTESLAEYSALMAVEKQFGAEKVRHILRSDLDSYLSGRSKELGVENPLFRTENQVYIQYRKGSLVFYRLREEIGEANLNRALKHFLDDLRYKTAPYPTSADLLRYIRAEASADKQELITDLFERIVFHGNRVLEASAKPMPNGKWDVTVKINLAKTEVDGKGKETVRAYDEAVELAIFARAPGAKAKDEHVLHHEKRRLPSGESTLHFTVNEKPSEFGVDPYNLLIDRNAKEHRKQVEIVQ
ncbi:MAG: hypothetical protein K2P84_11955 [Undibacterium sp.]|nr:hypothetical protein [Undibacterium sp.]